MKNHITNIKLMQMRSEIESLTRHYIEKLWTSRENAAHYANFLNAIFESIGDALVVYDQEDNVILANNHAAFFCGFDIKNLSRHAFINCFQIYDMDGETPISPQEFPYEVAKREGKVVEREGLLKGEGLPHKGIWIRSNAAPVKDEKGNLLGIVTVINNIDQQKRLQLERKTVASLITHDLKNHLGATISVLDLLCEKLIKKLDTEDQLLIANLRDESELFLEIANTLLEIYRTNLFSVDFQHSEINIEEILKEAVNITHQYAERHKVKITLEMSEFVEKIKGNPISLRQVFHNLLHNAISASTEGQTVAISCVIGNNDIIVNIKDHGKGISEANLSKLFNPGFLTYKHEGSSSTGFGLYLSRQIIEAHDGKILCQSKVGEGTTFTVIIPTEA